MKRLRLFCLLVLVLTTTAVAAAEQKIATVADKVTLFLDGAQVTRTKRVDLPAGKSTLVFTGLSPYLDERSMQVQAHGGFTVTGVERRFDYVDSLAWSSQLMEYDAERRRIAARIEEIGSEQEVVAAEIELLKTNCSVANRTVVTSLQGIRELDEYYAARLKTLKTRARNLNAEVRTLNAKSADLWREICLLGGTPKKKVSEIVVQVEAPAACKASFELVYYVQGAGWYPAYDIRSAGVSAPLAVTYMANVYQNTCEDWRNVALTLSSSNPALAGTAPTLKTYWLDFGLAAPRYERMKYGSTVSGRVTTGAGEPLIGVAVQVPGSSVATTTDMEGRYSITLPEDASELRFSSVGYDTTTRRISGDTLDVVMWAGSQSLEEVKAADYKATHKLPIAVPEMSVDFADIDFDAEEMQSAPPEVERRSSPVGYEFAIRKPYTIPSGGKSVAVEIGRYELPAAYLYRCVPKVDRDAFLTAAATDWERLNLLEGVASVYFENTFIGKTVLQPDVPGDTLSFSLGRDRSIVVSRERVNDYTSRRAVGSSQSQEIAWKITVRNTRQEPVVLKLTDQIPVSKNGTIVVTAEETDGGTLSETGIVTWMLNLRPGEQRELSLRYKVKYPKGLRLAVE